MKGICNSLLYCNSRNEFTCLAETEMLNVTKYH